MEVLRVEFDATIDECVDVQLRLVSRTKEFRRQRWRSSWAFGASGAAVLTVIATIEAGHFSPTIAFVSIGAAVILGVIFGWLFGGYYDSYVRRHSRKMLDEMFRGAERIRCETELRPQGLWSRSHDTEISFAWQRLREIVDAEHGIELWFDPGLAIIRSRAFDTPERRHEFLQRVRELAPTVTVAKAQSP